MTLFAISRKSSTLDILLDSEHSYDHAFVKTNPSLTVFPSQTLEPQLVQANYLWQ